MQTAITNTHGIARTLEDASGRALDFLYGDERRTERTLGLAFLVLAFAIILQNIHASGVCAI